MKPFKDPIASKTKMEKKHDPWNFQAPAYDNRTSCSVSAGDDYGVGFRTPVGKETAASIKSGPIPQEAKCFSPEEIFNGEDRKG